MIGYGYMYWYHRLPYLSKNLREEVTGRYHREFSIEDKKRELKRVEGLNCRAVEVESGRIDLNRLPLSRLDRIVHHKGDQIGDGDSDSIDGPGSSDTNEEDKITHEQNTDIDNIPQLLQDSSDSDEDNETWNSTQRTGISQSGYSSASALNYLATRGKITIEDEDEANLPNLQTDSSDSDDDPQNKVNTTSTTPKAIISTLSKNTSTKATIQTQIVTTPISKRDRPTEPPDEIHIPKPKKKTKPVDAIDREQPTKDIEPPPIKTKKKVKSFYEKQQEKVNREARTKARKEKHEENIKLIHPD